MKPPFRVPDATYRVQLNSGFTFEDLAAQIPYLHDLGISDIYASPIFRASPGSTHGYDVCDQNEVNPELGGIEGLRKVSALLRERDMGLLADFVPNHMGIEGPFNWRWLDVLEHGHTSRYAPFFDIHWNPRQASLQDRILVPMLHDFYGRVLEEGGIHLEYQDGAFRVCYGELRFPLRPLSYATLLQRLAWFRNPGEEMSQNLEELAAHFRALPPWSPLDTAEVAKARVQERDALRGQLKRLVEKKHLQDDLTEVLRAINGTPGRPASFNNLHDILEEQHYRLSFWKSGIHEINYRRFFAVDTLVGLHMERQEVFDETHRLLKSLLEEGIVTGVRIDHIDGLWDPAQYLERLAGLFSRDGQPTYVLVEKILTEKEQLPAEWAVHGTSGYEFSASVINLLLDRGQEDAFTCLYRDFSGMNLDPDEQAYELKLFIMEELLPNAIDSLVDDIEARVKSDRRWRDWTGTDLRLALSRIIACLSVYRTYRRVGQPPGAEDIEVVERAVAATLKRNYASDPLPFEFMRDVWTRRYPDAQADPGMVEWVDLWVCKLQQYTGAIMAKSIEDTFFYRYVRLFGANEVGHHPAEFGLPTTAFHEMNAQRREAWPACMLSTSTHDTKLSEDARMRLVALSELPDRWAGALARWREANRGFKTTVGAAEAPDANEEYLLYQVLLAVWPLDRAQVDDTFRDRLRAYMRKAIAESKANTNWAVPNEAWMKAVCDFIDAILDPSRAPIFWNDFTPLADELAERGMKWSLVQTALKLTSPGVPDIYQGCDLWDLSLVDPDNRRPVDYGARRAALDRLKDASVSELLTNWKDGRIKLHVTRALLAWRREHAALSREGSYQPVTLEGPGAEAYVAFLREHAGVRMVVAAQCRLGDGGARPAATLKLPPGQAWQELLTGTSVSGDAISLAELLLPVAVFVSGMR